MHGLHAKEEDANGFARYPPTLESDTCGGVGDPIVTVPKVISSNAHGVVMGSRLIAVHYLCDLCADAIAALLSITFSRDLAPILCRSHHPTCKDSFIEIIEIGF